MEAPPPPPPPADLGAAPAPGGDPHAAAAAQNELAARGAEADHMRSLVEGRAAAPQAPVNPAAVAAEYKAAIKKGDYAKAADAIARMPAKDLGKLQAGKYDMGAELTKMRQADPAAYRKSMDALTEKVTDGKAGDKATELLGEHLGLDPQAAGDYIQRNLWTQGARDEFKRTHPFDTVTLQPPASEDLRNQAVIALSRCGNTLNDTVSALIHHGDPNSPSFAADLGRFPPSVVDAVGKPLVRQASAQAHDGKDTKARELADKAGLGLLVGGTAEGKEVGADHYAGAVADDAIKAGRECLGINSQIQGVKERLTELKAVRDLNGKQKTSVLTAKGQADLNEDIKGLEDRIAKLEGGKGKIAAKSLEKLHDPKFQSALKNMSPEDQSAILRPLISNLQGTPSADAFYDGVMKPLIDGKPSGLGEILKNSFEKSDKGREMGMGILELCAPQIAARGGLGALSAATQKVLGKTAGEIGELQEAIGKLNSAEKGSDAAKAALKEVEDLAGAGVNVNTIKSAFAGVALMVTLGSLPAHPDVKDKLAVAKDSGAFVNAFGELLAKTPELKSCAKLLGGAAKAAGVVAGVAQAVIGVMDMNEAIKYQDPGGAVGCYLEAAGGVIACGGAVIPPLAALGGVVGAAGFVVRKVFGDSDEVRALKGFAQNRGYQYK